MRALHLISNRKLTGPVDPALRLARALYDLHVDARVAVGRELRGAKGPIDDLVRERELEPITTLLLSKHRRLLMNRGDVRQLVKMLEVEPVEVLHAHLDNAHTIAARARRGLHRALELPSGMRRPLLVRSLYDAQAPPPSLRYRWLYGREADGVFVYGARVREALLARFRLPLERVVKLDGAVDSERFRPLPREETLRSRLELPDDAVVVGIVARIQRHRRFSVLLEAIHKVMEVDRRVHFVVLGRGTHAVELAHEKVRELGIGERVRLPGYIGGAEYPRALASFDIKVFLVPGSDGTCRAVREAMACGMPVVASRRGLLPEIVRDGLDGLVVDDEVAPLAEAIGRLARDDELRAACGARALERARTTFSLKAQAERVRDAYARWFESAGRT